ncbi:matrilysin-like [Orbicella faveolata]|uniref:matrilysin-like n=1 Tax=Orbicella faveolata TaxID=48498 RepID=UPI0009E1F5E0|nr:matrilysin-like [Orbicella faveolata]
MLGFPQKICLIFTIVLSTNVEFIMGKPVNNAKLNPLLEKYLRRYGYLKPATKVFPHWRASWDQEITQSSMEGEQEIEQAIRKLQNVAGLPVTGKITDEEAVKIINQRRCGMKDFHTGKRTKRFALEGTFWHSKNLTYKIQSFSSNLSREDIAHTIEKALQMWSNVSQLTFTRVTTPGVKADLNIRFVSGYHGDDHPTDGPGRELAHSFYPSDNRGLAGEVHFDDDETFSINGGFGVDFLWLAVHELGHSLGLEDSNNHNSVMYQFYTGYRPNLRLSRDDIKGIQQLYGAKADPATTRSKVGVRKGVP